MQSLNNDKFKYWTILVAGFSLLSVSSQAMAAKRSKSKQQDEPKIAVIYGPTEPWVAPPPAESEAGTASNAHIKNLFSDYQVRATPDGVSQYIAIRAKAMSPEGLRLGQVLVSWRPDAGSATVHHVRIIRDGIPIDVLATQKLEIVRREANLEGAWLDGVHVAAMQVAGMRVGDTIDFATTITTRDKLLTDMPSGIMQFRTDAVNGRHRFRLVADKPLNMTVRATPDLPPAIVEDLTASRVQSWVLEGPNELPSTKSAPGRFGIKRRIEYSAFPDWNRVSSHIHPAFSAASLLSANSPLKAEAARIANEAAEPEKRAALALNIVRNQIRYVYVGLNGQNLIPRHADQVWQDRFGDCKGKTVVLLALLRELGIAAEAVLVTMGDDDHIGQSIPLPGLFNHVAVRATIGGKSYWLDGTEAGAEDIEFLDPPQYAWMLPLRENGAALEKTDRKPAKMPHWLTVTEVDASAGTKLPAPTKIRHVVRGAMAISLQNRFSSLGKSELDKALREALDNEDEELKVEKVDFSFDKMRAIVVLTGSGHSKPSFDGTDRAGRILTKPGMPLPDASEWKRADDQDKSLPWKTDFPGFLCHVFSIKLPQSVPPFRWRPAGKTLRETRFGNEVWDQSWLDGQTYRGVSSRRVVFPELAAEMVKADSVKPDFNMREFPHVTEDYPTSVKRAGTGMPVAGLQGAFDAIHWTSEAVPCRMP